MQNLSVPFIFQGECRMKIEHVLFPSVFSKLRIRLMEGHFYCVHTIRFSEPTKIGSLKKRIVWTGLNTFSQIFFLNKRPWFVFHQVYLLQSQASNVNRMHYLTYWTSSWHLLLHIQATGNVFSVVCSCLPLSCDPVCFSCTDYHCLAKGFIDSF